MERTIEIEGISDELLTRLDECAGQMGVDRSSYVRHLIERAVAPPSAAGTLAELLASVHDFSEAHGIEEGEIERLFNAELTESRRERRGINEGGRSKQ